LEEQAPVQSDSISDTENQRRLDSWINNTHPEGTRLTRLRERWENWKDTHIPERGVGTLGKIVDTVKNWFED
jgi:hypothetical protein